ncbi:MAG TPA: GH116 family glycosyl hydrolase, partial [Chloroflexota bacterium]|nr:GH116 family glycosyl hydrolase [Chloroflexota bacterium]
MAAVAFIRSEAPSQEEAAAWGWLATTGLDAAALTPAEALERLAEQRLLWWHAAAPSPPRLRPAEAERLRAWLAQGGRLLLTLHAASLLEVLGLEDRAPDEQGWIPWQHSPTELDALEGERRGVVGFGPHPIFDGLQRGAVLLQPHPGAAYPQAVYTRPVRGRLVAAEWQYLALDADRRIVLEHAPGAGRALTVGAYLLFGEAENPYRLFLQRFARSCLDYLLALPAVDPSWYWPAVELKAARSGLGGDIARLAASAELARIEGRALVSEGAGDAQFDLTGRRIVVLGRYRAGVTEVWSLPLRLARNVRATFDGTPEGEALRQVRIQPASVERTLETRGATLRQTVSTTADEATIRYQLLSGRADVVEVTFDADLRWFWPYPEGVLGRPALRATSSASEMAIVDGAGVARAFVRFEPWPDELAAAPSDGHLRITARFQAPRSLALTFRGTTRADPSAEEPLLEVETPDEAFNQELFWALNGLRSFDVESPVGRGLVAGFAETGSGWWAGRLGYAWYFGRDTFWSLPACLAAGMHEASTAALRLFARHQGLDGKIVHELTPGGTADFTSADSTPLFLVALERCLRWTGDLDLLRELWPNVMRAWAFCLTTDRDGDRLIENTGVGHGWSEGGRIYGAHATFYLNACWAAALDAMAKLAGLMEDQPLAARCRAAAEDVKRQLNGRFYRPADGWFAYGIAGDGSLMEARTMEPAVAALFGLLDPPLTGRFFDELASERFTAPWGVRYIARDDPAYHPRGYHYGSV